MLAQNHEMMSATPLYHRAVRGWSMILTGFYLPCAKIGLDLGFWVCFLRVLLKYGQFVGLKLVFVLLSLVFGTSAINWMQTFVPEITYFMSNPTHYLHSFTCTQCESDELGKFSSCIFPLLICARLPILLT